MSCPAGKSPVNNTVTSQLRARNHFRMVDFEATASRENRPSGADLLSAFAIPSLQEAQCVYLAAQWLFAFVDTITSSTDSAKQPSESSNDDMIAGDPHRSAPSPKIDISIEPTEALRLQTMAVNSMVYGERIRLMFYPSEPLGFSCACDMCGTTLPLQDLAMGCRVTCASCGLTTECCAHTFRPVSILPSLPYETGESKSESVPVRRCPLCASLSFYNSSSVCHAESCDWDFSWMPNNALPSMCLYCLTALDYVP